MPRHLRVWLSLAAALLVSVSASVAAPAAPTLARASLSKPAIDKTHWVKVEWKDNSSQEDGFLIQARLGRSGGFQSVAYSGSNASQWYFAINAFPTNTILQFRVVAFTGNVNSPTSVSAPSNISEVAVPPDSFDAPGNLTATPTRGGVIQLKWEDRSTTEEYFAVEMRTAGNSTFDVLGTVYFNTPTVDITNLDVPGEVKEFRVRAVRDGGRFDPSTIGQNGTSATAYSNTATARVREEFTSAMSAQGYWQNNFEFEVKSSSPDLRTGISVTDLPPGLSFNATTRLITGVPTQVGNFTAKLKASYASLPLDITGDLAIEILSPFTNRPFEPATVGQPFSFQITLSNDNLAGNTTVTPGATALQNLPPGLTFDPATLVISGTPTQAGVYTVTLATTLGGSAPVTSGNLTLRVRPASGSPLLSGSSNVAIPMGGNVTLSLGRFFDDPDSASAVRLQTNVGDIDVILYTDSTPQTVRNFLTYVDAGDYDGTAFHRLIPGFVLQGGGFVPEAPPNRFIAVPARPSPINEPGVSNVRGTVAMAKVDGQPNSATTNFFFNLADNSGNLDNQNSGFTAFGRVAAPSLPVLDAIAALKTKTYNVVINNSQPVSFTDWPLTPATPPATMDNTKLVQIQKAFRIDPFKATIVGNQTSGPIQASINGGNLTFRGTGTGNATVTLELEDLDGNKSTQTLNVTIGQNATFTPPTGTPVSGTAFQFEDGKPATITAPAPSENATYTWTKNGIPVKAATAADLSFSAIKLTDAGIYRRTTVVGNESVVDTFLVGVLQFPRTPVMAKVGSKVVLGAKVAGPGFSVLWSRDGQPLGNIAGKIEGATTPTLTVSAIAGTDSGLYECVLVSPGEAAGLRIPRQVTALTGAPVLSFLYFPPVMIQEPSSFQVNWDKNAAVTPAAIRATGLPSGLTFNSTTGLITGRPTSAGNFTVKLSPANAVGTGVARFVPLTVTGLPTGSTGSFSGYIPADPDANNNLGGVVSLNVATAGTYTGELALGTTRLPLRGILNTKFGTTPTLEAQLTGNVSLSLALAGGNLTGNVTAASKTLPVTTRALVLPGLSVSELAGATIPWDLTLGLAPVKFEVTGLPPGLTFDPATRKIVGRATVSGTFIVTISAVHASGTRETRQIPLQVAALPVPSVGTFVALIGRDPVLNDNLGGFLNVTTSVTGAYSGRLVLGYEVYPFSGVLDAGGGDSPRFTRAVTRKNFDTLQLKATFTGNATNVELSKGDTKVTAAGRKAFGPGTSVGTYNTGLFLQAPDIGASTLVPQGHGFATVKIAANGGVTIAGRLADGTLLTAGSAVLADGWMPVHVIFPSGKDVFRGTAVVSYSNNKWAISGSAEWALGSTTAPRAVFPQTFSARTLKWDGGRYAPPAPGHLPAGFTAKEANAKLSFTEGGLVSEGKNPDLTLKIASPATVTLPATNPQAVTLTINPATGAFSGSFQILDPGATKPRIAPFNGLLLPGGGSGYFLLPQKANSPYLPALSGAVELWPN